MGFTGTAMTPHDHRTDPPVSVTPVYEQALAAVVQAVHDELRAAQNRLATPAEIEPLRQRIAALGEMRTRL